MRLPLLSVNISMITASLPRCYLSFSPYSTGKIFFGSRYPSVAGRCLYNNTLFYMHLQEARNFVTYFVKGEYQPKEYAEFLQWLRAATLKELNAIADEYESLEA